VAAATTGAPVLYDARAPRPAPTVSADGFGVDTGDPDDGSVGETGEPGEPDAAGDADASAAPVPSPPASGTPAPHSPRPTPPASADPDANPSDGLPTPEAQHAWLAFQQVVRECMADAGHAYRYWEWWNTAAKDPDATAPAMPTGLTPEAVTAWELAFSGTAGTGDDVDLAQAGCWGAAMQSIGPQQRSMLPDPPSDDQLRADPSPSTPAPTPGP
jgi:hypothetical protein